MFSKKKFCCIVLARKNSKGLKNKNLKKIENNPLIYYPIKAALKVNKISSVYFNSDSDQMLRYVSNKFPKCIIYKRSKKLGLDKTSSFEVLFDIIKNLQLQKKFEYFILLEPTSPLTSGNDIKKAINKILKNKLATSLLSVVDSTIPNSYFSFSLKNNYLIPSLPRQQYNLRRQDLKKNYFIDGSIYISKIKTYLKYKNFTQPKTLCFKNIKIKSFQIDDYIDYKIIKYLFKILKNKNFY
jgi:CMP-N,N'-diacetyllegionaminic acid synthase